MPHSATRLVAIDMDGTLLGPDGRVSPRNLAALRAAESAGIEVVIATGRRHCYAMRVLRELALHHARALISSNGAVCRTLGASSIAPELLDCTLLPHETSFWLLNHLQDFRNALVLTFDLVGPDGEDARGALVVEHLDELNASIGRWMAANEPYIAHIDPIEDALQTGAPIQMMLCGTIDRMARAEARLQAGGPSFPAVSERVGSQASSIQPTLYTLHRTEYPDRDLSILDILPAGCSKGAAVLRLAAARGIDSSQVLAIGDNWNDVSMFEVAGRVVVMGNAPGDLQALARERNWAIGPHNHADGVAEAIESILSVHA